MLATCRKTLTWTKSEWGKTKSQQYLFSPLCKEFSLKNNLICTKLLDSSVAWSSARNLSHRILFLLGNNCSDLYYPSALLVFDFLLLIFLLIDILKTHSLSTFYYMIGHLCARTRLAGVTDAKCNHLNLTGFPLNYYYWHWYSTDTGKAEI